MTATASIKGHGLNVASNYIIALEGGDKGKFIVCQLHAAPLPGRPLEAAEFSAGPGR